MRIKPVEKKSLCLFVAAGIIGSSLVLGCSHNADPTLTAAPGVHPPATQSTPPPAPANTGNRVPGPMRGLQQLQAWKQQHPTK